MKVDYADAGFPVRDEFAESHTRFWQRLSSAGSWYTASERVAIAEAVRQARKCEFCDSRVQALSPRGVQGQHTHNGALSSAAIEAIHSITRDASRLTRQWYADLLEQGLSEGQYIEIVGTVVSIVSIDCFADAIGVPQRDLPSVDAANSDTPVSSYAPATATHSDQAWVAMVPEINEGTPEADLWPSGLTGNVVRAMSLVPDEVRTLKDLSAAHYLPMSLVRQAGVDAGRALHRSQMELVAGRVSALNSCYY